MYDKMVTGSSDDIKLQASYQAGQGAPIESTPEIANMVM